MLTIWLFQSEWQQSDSLPLQSTTVATVPLFNAWTIGWNAGRIAEGMQNYWEAPIFYPADNAFAFSEPQPATMLVAPIVWITGSVVTAYKSWLFLAVLLNGVFTGLLLRRLQHSAIAQAAGGSAVILLPIVWQRIDVSQLISLWGILWFWSCLAVLPRAASLKRGLETGFAFATCFALCVHHSLFLSLLTPFGALLFLPCLRHKQFVLATVVSLITATILILPIVQPIRTAADEHNFARKEKLIRDLSAQPIHYLASPPRSLVRFEQFDARKSRQFCVGWARMTLALSGLVIGLWRPGRRRWVAFMAITGGMAFVFSQGLRLQLLGWQPWQFLLDHVPGVDQVRSVYRFAYFVQLSIVLLAVESLAALSILAQRPAGKATRIAAKIVLVIIPSLILAAEVYPEPSGRGGIPQVKQHRTWTTFVRENASPGRPILCLPMSPGSSVSDYDITTRWMCYGLEHGVPMLNGYSGFFPQSYISMRQMVQQQFPSAEVLKEFQRRNVEFLVVVRIYCGPEIMRAMNSTTVSTELVLEDPIGIDVYRLVSAKASSEAPD